VSGDIFDRYPALRGKPAEMAMFVALLQDKGNHADAMALGEAAIAAAPDSLSVRDHVVAALSKRVAPFHGPMLLDEVRNAAYARAIEQAVRPGMLVLEIGAGSGLLAMLAARAGARVVTCESNPLVAEAARTIVERNGYADRVTVIAKRSDELQIPDDLPAPADLVIHEIFGSQLVDEGVDAALTDARQRLLKPGAPSVPSAAAVRCALAMSSKFKTRPSLRSVQGFDLSYFEMLVRPKRSIFSNRRAGLERRSAVVSMLHMDYDIQPPFGQASETIALESTGGRVDGVVQWIAIQFADGSIHENDPFADRPDSSWAAVYHEFRQPVETLPGTAIEVTLRRRGEVLTLDAAPQPSG
jgi:type II protein arginine methyltransferase